MNHRISVFRSAGTKAAGWGPCISVGTSATRSAFPKYRALTQAQRELLDLIDAIANDLTFYLDMDFQPGDMQFLKNAVILDARTDYEDWQEPERKRHLLRMWLTNFSFKDGDLQVRQDIRTEKTG